MNIPSIASLMYLTSYDYRESVKNELMKLDPAQRPNPSSPEENQEFALATLENDAQTVSEIVSAFVTGKFYGESANIKEVMTSIEYPKLFMAATEILMMNRLSPARVITENLFEEIPYTGQSANVTIRTLGGVKVEEVPEGGNYPETGTAVADQAYRIALAIRKFGAKVGGTRELIESDNWGIFAATLAMLKDELDNNRENLAMQMLNNQAGYVLIDNANAANVALGSATGRGIDGSFNGAFGLDDAMNLISWMEMRGYYVDSVLLHPFMWSMWQRDPEIREVMLGSSVQYVPNGNAAPGWGDPFGGLGAPWSRFGSTIPQTTPAVAQAGLSGFNTVDPIYGKLGISNYAWPNLTPFGATYQAQPKHIDRPLKVIVTPLVPYYKISGSTKYATNLIFADSRKCGLILRKENPTFENWKDIEREIDWIKIRERFGMALKEQGRAIAVARNIVIDRTYAFDNVNSATLSAVDTSVNRI